MKNSIFDTQFYKQLIIEKYNIESAKGHSGASVMFFFKREHPNFFEYLKLNYPGDFGKRAYLFVHDLNEIPLCQHCHKKPARWYNFKRGFGKWCSMSCMNHDETHKKSMHETMIKKYGHPHALQNEKINTKLKSTIGNKITKPERWIHSNKQYIKTCIERHGVENVMFDKNIVKKQREAIFEKYGVFYPTQNEELKKRALETLKAKVAKNPNYWKDRYQKTILTFVEKYGTKYPQRDIGLGLEKRKKTSLKHYGVEWYTQTHDCHKNRRKRIEFNKMFFDTHWEVKVYKYCLENNIQCEYQPSISFVYESDGKKHVYHPDFLINDKLYEVKGDHFFRINKITGEEEMFLPFRGKNMTDEQYEEKCKCFNAKYHCMLDNGIIILRKNEIQNLDKIFKP